jgi:hypothetical protein
VSLDEISAKKSVVSLWSKLATGRRILPQKQNYAANKINGLRTIDR